MYIRLFKMIGVAFVLVVYGCSNGGNDVASVGINNPAASLAAARSADPPQQPPAVAFVALPILKQAITQSSETLPWRYAELWNSSGPFTTTVSQLKSHGAQVVSQTYMQALWAQGVAGSPIAEGIPIYVGRSTDPVLTASCTMYGSNCNAKGVRIHVPSYATPQQSSDAHITIVDQNSSVGQIELDCWQTVITGSQLKCSWAGIYKTPGSGVSENGNEGIHAGMAVSSVFTVGAEVADGNIGHALGFIAHCLNSPAVYPADTSVGTDYSCGGSTPPHYGNLVHLLWSSSQIASSSYSSPCKVILTALATYGAYLTDTGNNGLQLDTQNELSYTASPQNRALDPWPAIQSKLDASGDGGYGSWHSCLNRLQASNFELLQIARP